MTDTAPTAADHRARGEHRPPGVGGPGREERGGYTGREPATVIMRPTGPGASHNPPGAPDTDADADGTSPRRSTGNR